MKISLIGYMGCGKTTIGKLLSKKLNCKLYDLDKVIINNQNDSIKNIFKKKGENYFRKTENFLLKKILRKKEKYILSVGGGTPCFYKNITLLNKYSKTFYLKASTNLLVNRLIKNKNIKNTQVRPLINNVKKNELFNFIKHHLLKRSYYYEQSIKKINIEKKSEVEICEEIMTIIKFGKFLL